MQNFVYASENVESILGLRTTKVVVSDSTCEFSVLWGEGVLYNII